MMPGSFFRKKKFMQNDLIIERVRKTLDPYYYHYYTLCY